MIILLLIFEVLILGYIDYKIYGSIYTPVTVLAAPFIFIVLFNLACGKSTGLVPLFVPSLWIWIVGLPVFWLPSLIMSLILIKKSNVVQNPFKELRMEDSRLISFFIFLSGVFLLLMYPKLIDGLFRFGFGSQKLSDSLSGDLPAHASVWLLLPVTYFLIISSFKKKYMINWIIILLWLFFAFSYNSKTWILIPLVGGLIGRIIIKKDKITIKKGLILIGIGVLIFFLSYSISFRYWTSLDFVKDHFMSYINAGLLSFSEYQRLHGEVGISLKFLYAPIFNIYYKITGKELISILSDLNVLIGNNYNSNVKTFFGEIYIYGGFAGGIITSFIWGGICYLFLFFNILFKEITFFIMYLIILAALFFGWFGIYFNNLTYYELLVASVFLVLLISIIFNKGKLKTYCF